MSAIIFGILGWSVVGIVGGLTLGLVVWLVWSGRGFVAGLVVGFAEGEGSPRGPFERACDEDRNRILNVTA